MKKSRQKLFGAFLLGLLLALCFSFTASAAKSEIVTKNGKKYYYNSAGKLVTSKYGYKIGKYYYKISSRGVLTKISKVEGLAGIQLDRLNKKYSGKASKSKLCWEAFQWSAQLKYYPNSTRIPSGQTKETYFGLYGFQKKRGDCNVQAATFYWMAKALGYKVSFVRGYVPQAVDSNGNCTKFGAHAWTTMKLKDSKGKYVTYVFDPNFSGYCQQNHILKGLRSGYKFRYGTKNTYRYFNSRKKEIK